MTKVIWYNIKVSDAWDVWEAYFLWEYRGISKVYVDKLYPWKVSSKVIIKEWSEREIEDATYNTDRMKKDFNIS